MLAARFLGNRRIAAEEVPTPHIDQPDSGPGKVVACGICGSDRRVVCEPSEQRGIPGHEAVGQVMAVGEVAIRARVGDRVAVCNVIGCGHCH